MSIVALGSGNAVKQTNVAQEFRSTLGKTPGSKTPTLKKKKQNQNQNKPKKQVGNLAISVKI